MSTGSLIRRLLDQRDLPYEWVIAPDTVSLREDWLERTVPLDSVARIRILKDAEGLVFALLPQSHQLDLERLRKALSRKVDFHDAEAFAQRLNTVLDNQSFQLNRRNGFQFIVDEALTNQDVIHFVSDKACTLLQVTSDDLQQITDDVLLGSHFSEAPAESQQAGPSANGNIPNLNLKARLAQIDRLPAMPQFPAQILALRNNPDSTVDDLVAIVEQDISLSALVIRYANSAMFQQRETVLSIKDAIFRVLGYETVLNLALGYALGRVFKLPQDGPLGHEHFWQHASYCAALAYRLCQLIPKAQRPKAGAVYLAALLHDIGYLVLHLFFRSEYAWLNKLLQANPHTPPVEIEQRLLGLTHMDLGAWLMRAWDMPGELIVAASEHHHLKYEGQHAQFVALINLSERLLKMHNLSDATSDDIPPQLLERLGLEEEAVLLTMDEVLAGGSAIREMAGALSA